MASAHRRATTTASLLMAGAIALAGCTGGSSTGTAKHATTPTAQPSGTGSAAGSSASSSPVPAATGSPSITPAALRRIVVADSARNNVANRQNSYALLRHIDGGLELAQDRAYTKAGAVNGYRVPAFYSVGTSVAVPTTTTAAAKYAVAEVLVGDKPPRHGVLPGPTSPQLSVYAKTQQGWRLANVVSVAGVKNLAAFAAPDASGVVSPGSSAGVTAARARVLAVASSCISQRTPAQISKPASCGEIGQARLVPSFHVTASLGATHWPTYTVALAGGSTLVIGAVTIAMTVRSAQGIQWQQGSIVTGLLGLKAKSGPAVRHGYAEQLVMSVALVLPADGGKATVLGVETGDLSAHRLAALKRSGGAVSV